MHEAGVLQPWISTAVVDIMLRLGKALYLGVNQWTAVHCQENYQHMDVLITFLSTSKKLLVICIHKINKEVA